MIKPRLLPPEELERIRSHPQLNNWEIALLGHIAALEEKVAQPLTMAKEVSGPGER